MTRSGRSLPRTSLRPQGVQVGLDVRGRDNRTTSGGEVESLRAPEVPRATVDAADSAGGRVDRHLCVQAGDFLAAVAGAIGVDAGSDEVRHRRFGNSHAAFEQVDDLLLAGVLQLFQAGDGDGAGSLLDVVLGCGDHVGRGDRQGFVAAVVAGVRVLGEGQFLQDDVTAGERLDVAALLEAGEEGVVLGDVVGDVAGT